MNQQRSTHRLRSDEDLCLQAYFEEIGGRIPLTPEQEIELARRIAAGDACARERLAEANLLFVVTVAKQYQNMGMTLLELVSAGNVGLMTAVDRFDPDRGAKFITYAVWWIRQAIQQALADEVRTVRLPTNRVGLLLKIRRARRRLASEGDVDDETVARALEVPVQEVREHMLDGRRVESLDRAMLDDDDTTLLDTLCCPDADQPDTSATRTSSRARLLEIIEQLSDRECEIIVGYFGLDGTEPMTLDQIGARLGVTRERVRQLKERALDRLRHPARIKLLRGLEVEP